ncbi:Shedu anti-phage system protein SduA domain-containing protein [Xanthobacter sp. V0B-10]|uniref:Shedu anti-phage system protein SduA domain-containing protein n=1 Tax=Xanthobacter albus TaxID=3119929 RepID=UPI0037291669
MTNAKDLREEYLTLLDGGHNEQVYQRFIETHTQLTPRDFVQNHGVHLRLVLRKLSFGADFKSDFFFLSKSSDDWNAVFIEIEKPTSRFFKDGSQEFHPDFVHALQQINSWRAWLSIDGNMPGFVSQLSSLRVPTTMQRNPTYPKFVLVFGRRAEYQDSELRRSRIRAEEREDFKIITFDSLAEGLSGKERLWLGVRRAEFIDLQDDEIVDDNIFIWADPHMLTVSETLHTQIKKVAAKNTQAPFHISGRGHLASNLHPNALEVKVWRGAPAAVPVT